MSEERFDQMDARLERIDERFAAVDARFDRVDERFAAVHARFDRVDERFAAVDARFDRVDERLVAIDARFDRVDSKINDLGREMRTLYEDLKDEIRALAPDFGPIRREFKAADTQLHEDLERRLQPLEVLAREQARRRSDGET